MTLDPTRSESYPLMRRQVVADLLAERGETLVVSGLGAPSWDVTAAGEDARCFPLWGAMGGAVMVGLGLALAQPARRVLVITGDGELLMGLGSLAVVAAKQPTNLAIAVLDNERYGETGMQATHTAGATDLAATARGLGIAQAETVAEETELAAAKARLLAAPGPLLIDIKVRAEDLPLVLPPKDGVALKMRFRRALLGTD
ncbi:MAG: thiamine pyrophosphate-dependent enzyme [Pseudomonadota bacterium]